MKYHEGRINNTTYHVSKVIHKITFHMPRGKNWLILFLKFTVSNLRNDNINNGKHFSKPWKHGQI